MFLLLPEHSPCLLVCFMLLHQHSSPVWAAWRKCGLVPLTIFHFAKKQYLKNPKTMMQVILTFCPKTQFDRSILFANTLFYWNRYNWRGWSWRLLLPRLVCRCLLLVCLSWFIWLTVCCKPHPVHVLHTCSRNLLPASLAPQSPCWIDDGLLLSSASPPITLIGLSISHPLTLSVVPPSLMIHSEQMRALRSTPPCWSISLGRKGRQSSHLTTSTGTNNNIHTHEQPCIFD